MNRFILYYLFINLTANHSFLAQNSGLLKNEKITTYWNKEKKQVRRKGFIKQMATLKLGLKLVNGSITTKWKYSRIT